MEDSGVITTFPRLVVGDQFKIDHRHHDLER